MFFGEHSHLPAARQTKFRLDAEMPDYFREMSDPFVCMAAAAAVTERLKIGTSVCLVPEHHPEVAEFHGGFVNFDPLWCSPKPVQPGGPPVLIGAGATPRIARHIVEYCDGLMPMDGQNDLEAGMASIRAEADRVGRPLAEFDFTAITGYQLAGISGNVQRIRELAALGFNRVLLLLAPDGADAQWAALDRLAELRRAAG